MQAPLSRLQPSRRDRPGCKRFQDKAEKDDKTDPKKVPLVVRGGRQMFIPTGERWALKHLHGPSGVGVGP